MPTAWAAATSGYRGWRVPRSRPADARIRSWRDAGQRRVTPTLRSP
jgi:hypothetical protein